MTDLSPPGLWLTYYADDFTGATDALERLELAGVRSALYMSPPSPEAIAQRPELRAVGVAGVTRSLPTEQLADEVRPALAALKLLGAPHVHYKVCSTFDSSPTVGSIGRVIDIAAEQYDAPFTPVVVGAPALGRWVVFGNLFAGMGIGAASEAYRLDRHPSMSRHPVTPADESDLRVCLARQTDRSIGLIDVRTLARPTREIAAVVNKLHENGQHKVVLFDTLEPAHLKKIGELLDPIGDAERPLFWVGSSAVESALTAHWQSTGRLQPNDQPLPSGARPPVLVLAGSCSPITDAQVEAAVQAGYSRFELSAEAIAADDCQPALDEVAQQAVACLKDLRCVVVTTRRSADAGSLPPERLGAAFAKLSRSLLGRTRPNLLVIAGGDTSSHTAQALGIESLEFVAPLTPGAPICQASSANPAIDGLRVVFKGGQVGRPSFFASLGGSREDA